MTDTSLRRLASATGVATAWKDVFGETHLVAVPTLRSVIEALGYPASTESDVADSYMRVASTSRKLPQLITAQAGQPIFVPGPALSYSVTLEDGRIFEGTAERDNAGATIPAILETGYHHLHFGDSEAVVAVTPPRCPSPRDVTALDKSWGLAVQLYSLRRRGGAGIGDFKDLAALAPQVAQFGASAIAISPVHAQFSAGTYRFSPYAPSSRTALNVLHIGVNVSDAGFDDNNLVDWSGAAGLRLQHLRRQFEMRRNDPHGRKMLADFKLEEGDRVWGHVVFEALHAHLLERHSTNWHWRDWPTEFQDPASRATGDFVAEHQEEVDFHLWLQMRAEQDLSEAQAACINAGMGIGLISDLAVGTDSAGSQCWSRQRETLIGLTVGAPPDLLQRRGQNWGLTAFSPLGLIESGFQTFRDMLHTALAHAGGMRIDHAMGLNRLWVIPAGADAADGAYLSFPERDLLGLIKLESARHRAIVLGEDLGTLPDGFQQRLEEGGVDGMRILWFERDPSGEFTSPERWTRSAAAMSSTHDLPTLAGWWTERDLDWQERLGHSADAAGARSERSSDRQRLWQTMRDSSVTVGPEPSYDDGDAFADAAVVHLGRSACELVILPVEDALGLVEQPNMPGTIDEHPNWQRRLPAGPPDGQFDERAASRLQSLNEARKF